MIAKPLPPRDELARLPVYAVDFESFYNKECSVSVLGPVSYFAHPQFDPYLVTVIGSNGFEWAGNPKEFDWTQLDGAVVVSHNAAFDQSLYLFGVSRAWWGACDPAGWLCTADLCAYLGSPRSLAGATKFFYGTELSKDVRDAMMGKRWETMTPEFQERVVAYAIEDSRRCLQLWMDHGHKWPDPERAVSLLNRRICQRGIPLDEDMLRQNLEGIRVRLFEAESAIPWASETTPLSRKSLNQACRQMGIDPPASLAKDSPDADAWLAKHRNDCPWVSAVSDYRRINSFIKKLEAFNLGTQPDGRYYGGYMYFGANPTGRFSGSGGNLNLQNLPRGEMFGVQFREMIRPRPGKVLVVADLSQIEVRTLSYLAGDFRALEEIRKADDIYHAFGVLLGLHDPANGPLKAYSSALRSQVKMITLGCGFGMSANGFAAKEGISLAEAETAVGLYRAKMKSVVDYWKSLDEDIRMSSALNQPLRIELPSSRVMDYGLLRRMKNSHGSFSYVGKMVRQGQVRDFRLWHGLMCENCAQATARDIFCDLMLAIDQAGHQIIMHTHDEVVIECDAGEAEDRLKDVLAIMSRPPEWIPAIPLAAEGQVTEVYTK
jgi:DNA polymerase